MSDSSEITKELIASVMTAIDNRNSNDGDRKPARNGGGRAAYSAIGAMFMLLSALTGWVIQKTDEWEEQHKIIESLAKEVSEIHVENKQLRRTMIRGFKWMAEPGAKRPILYFED